MGAMLRKEGVHDVWQLEPSGSGDPKVSLPHHGLAKEVPPSDATTRGTLGRDCQKNDMKDHQAVIAKADRDAKAAKADNARVPVEFWREWIILLFPHLSPGELESALDNFD